MFRAHVLISSSSNGFRGSGARNRVWRARRSLIIASILPELVMSWDWPLLRLCRGFAPVSCKGCTVAGSGSFEIYCNGICRHFNGRPHHAGSSRARTRP